MFSISFIIPLSTKHFPALRETKTFSPKKQILFGFFLAFIKKFSTKTFTLCTILFEFLENIYCWFRVGGRVSQRRKVKNDLSCRMKRVWFDRNLTKSKIVLHHRDNQCCQSSNDFFIMKRNCCSNCFKKKKDDNFMNNVMALIILNVFPRLEKEGFSHSETSQVISFMW